jgi:hypothetical protein
MKDILCCRLWYHGEPGEWHLDPSHIVRWRLWMQRSPTIPIVLEYLVLSPGTAR